MSVPARLAADAEKAELPAGSDERFAGYGVMGLPFASGHLLALRRFPASSIGPAYTSVWHREPDGRWVFWQDQQDDQGCPRYFSAALSESRKVDIELSWRADSTLRVVIPALLWCGRPIWRGLRSPASSTLWGAPCPTGRGAPVRCSR
jgi:hypothetical protein